jgi:tRNA (guanosine-2'-O-)-methyltransferase
MANKILNAAINEDRALKFKNVVAKRQKISVILENVHDPHNIGAIVRSCDAIGVSEIYVVYTEGTFNHAAKKVGKNASSGARKWINTYYYDNIATCIVDVRKKYNKIYGTHLSTDSLSLYDLDLTDSVALMFGNEHIGISEEAINLLDDNFIIPQYGMVQSLNVSVACAVSLFEASRQRSAKGLYHQTFDQGNLSHITMFEWFAQRHLESIQKKER